MKVFVYFDFKDFLVIIFWRNNFLKIQLSKIAMFIDMCLCISFSLRYEYLLSFWHCVSRSFPFGCLVQNSSHLIFCFNIFLSVFFETFFSLNVKINSNDVLNSHFTCLSMVSCPGNNADIYIHIHVFVLVQKNVFLWFWLLKSNCDIRRKKSVRIIVFSTSPFFESTSSFWRCKIKLGIRTEWNLFIGETPKLNNCYD